MQATPAMAQLSFAFDETLHGPSTRQRCQVDLNEAPGVSMRSLLCAQILPSAQPGKLVLGLGQMNLLLGHRLGCMESHTCRRAVVKGLVKQSARAAISDHGLPDSCGVQAKTFCQEDHELLTITQSHGRVHIEAGEGVALLNRTRAKRRRFP